MVNKPLAIKMLRDLWARRGALFALILILATGISCYTGMEAIYYDMDGARDAYYNKYNLADFTLDLKRAPGAAVYPLTKLANILRLRKRIKIDAMVNLPLKSYHKIVHPIPGVVMSLPFPRRNIINNVRMVSGTWFSSAYANEILVNQQFMQTRNLRIGDRIRVRFPDEERNLLIIGTVSSPEYAFVLAPGSLAPDPGGLAIMYAPFRFLQQYTDLNGSFNQLLGVTQDKTPVAIQNTMELLAAKLDNYGVQFKTAQQDQISVKILHDELVNIKKSISFFPSMFLLVAILVLNIILGRLVKQQRTVIGTLKALGYRKSAILRHYLSFGLAIGLLGGILGLGLGYGLQSLLLIEYNKYFIIPNMHTQIYPSIMLAGIAVSVISALLGACSGAYGAMRLAPAEAMRPPTPEIGTHIFLERFKKIWQALSFQNKMVVRAICRNKLRSWITIIAAIVATALVFSALEFLDSMYKMANFSFDKIQHQDYKLALRDPLGKDILRSIAILPGVKKIEGQLIVPAKLQHGPYVKDTEITGLPKNNQLYTPVDKQARRITTDTTGVVINATLAKILHAQIGDKITVRPLIGNRTITKAKVVKIINTYLGLSVYVDQTWLSHLLGNSYVISHILFQLDNQTDESKFMAAINMIAPMIDLISTKVAKKLFMDSLNEFMLTTSIVMILFAGVIAMGAILNTSMISLSERERDVASLRVLGFTSVQTAKIFLVESVVLNCLGIFLGLFGGIAFAYYLCVTFSTEVYRMPIVIKLSRLAETALIMLFFVLTSQIIIYYVIRRLNWFEILNVKE